MRNAYQNKVSLNESSKMSNAIINTFFSIYSVICLIPIILVVMISFTDEKALEQFGYSLFPKELSVSAYKFIFQDPSQIVRAYGITIFVTIAGTILSLIMTAMYAYPISRKDFKYKNFFSFYVYFTMLFSGGLVPWYILYSRYLHLKDTIWVLIIPYLINAFNLLVMRTYFSNNIPSSIIESAKIDGASEIRIFVQIVIPLAKPVFATIGLFSTLTYWNDWWLSLIFIVDDKKVNLQYLMNRILRTIQYISQNKSQMGGSVMDTIPTESVRMAMCVIGMGPILFAYPFFQKYFIKGLTVGAVKG